jgi:AsmA-like C-terminal region
MIKKILKITGIILLLLITVAFATPFIFKGKIISLVKNEVNKNLTAKVEFSDVNLSLFKKFPRLSATIENISIAGKGVFEKDTLLKASAIDAALNLMSVIKGDNIDVYSVSINNPSIYAHVLPTGEANWDIMKPSADSNKTATSDSAKPFKLQLQQYEIKNAAFIYNDEQAKMLLKIDSLYHIGKGDFTSNRFILGTTTNAAAVSFTYAGVPYLNNSVTSIDADIDVDAKNNQYNFVTDKIKLNGLQLATNGFFKIVNDTTYSMDINFKSLNTDLKNILSLIPAIYAKDFAKIKTSGQTAFNGFVKGTYNSVQIPAYDIKATIENGLFQYPDLPKPVKNINLALHVNNPDGVTDHTIIDISKAHIEFDEDPFDFRLLLKNPVTSMFINAAAKGKLNLGKITQFVKLEAGTKLSGLLNADVTANGSVEALQKQQYDGFNAAGTIQVNDLKYSAKDYPEGILLNKLAMQFNPRTVTLNEVDGQYLTTNFSGNGVFNNLLPYVLKNYPLSGTLNVTADKVNVNDWMGETSAAQNATSPGGNSTASASTTKPFAVPANLAITVNANADNVLYDKTTITNLSGALILKDETVTLNNIKGNALDGTIIMNGSYSTKESKTKPAISINYDVKDVDVQKTFFAFNTVQKLMPIGQFLGGKLTSQLKMNGNLTDSMMPDLKSLTGNGSLLLIEGFLSKFAPLEKLASAINVKELQNISLKDVKQYIEFVNGQVFVKPFKVKVKDIEMQIGGMHGFDQSLNYLINLKVPRALMGTKADQFLNGLAAQAASKGLPVKLSDMVNLQVKMEGSLKNPQLKIDIKQSAQNLTNDLKQQVQDFAKAKIDSTKKVVKDSVNAIKKQLVKDAKEELQKKIFGNKDSVQTGNPVENNKKRIEDAGKGIINNIFKKKKPADTTKQIKEE